MTRYTTFNIVWFTIAALTAALLLRNARKLLRVVRVAMVVVLMAFPWDYLAVAHRVWDYGPSGPRLFGVPLNDSIFIFSCSLFTSSILLSHVISYYLPAKDEKDVRGH